MDSVLWAWVDMCVRGGVSLGRGHFGVGVHRGECAC